MEAFVWAVASVTGFCVVFEVGADDPFLSEECCFRETRELVKHEGFLAKEEMGIFEGRICGKRCVMR